MSNKIIFKNKKGELEETTVSDHCTVTIKIQDGKVMYFDELIKKKMAKSTDTTSAKALKMV